MKPLNLYLKEPVDTTRYDRHIKLDEIGILGQQKLLDAKVLVVGAGGLGCPVLMYLTAAGVGTIGIVDDDAIEISNLQRQVLFNIQDLGKSKAEVAALKLRLLNPDVKFTTYTERIDTKNAINIATQYDIIIDGSDNFATRYLLNDLTVMLQRPLVSGAIHKFEGQVGVFNHNGSASYRCLFPENHNNVVVANCNDNGVLGVLPGIVGSLQANEVMKLILDIGDLLVDKILTFNALTNDFRVFKYKINKEEIAKYSFLPHEFVNRKYEIHCDIVNNESISVDQMLKLNFKEYLIVDVRDAYELDIDPMPEEFLAINIPLDDLINELHRFNDWDSIVTICATGKRSAVAAQIIKEKTGKNTLNLLGGISALNQQYS